MIPFQKYSLSQFIRDVSFLWIHKPLPFSDCIHDNESLGFQRNLIFRYFCSVRIHLVNVFKTKTDVTISIHFRKYSLSQFDCDVSFQFVLETVNLLGFVLIISSFFYPFSFYFFFLFFFFIILYLVIFVFIQNPHCEWHNPIMYS